MKPRHGSRPDRLLYRRTTVPQGLYRSTQGRKLAEFLSRDFTLEEHRQAAQASFNASFPCPTSPGYHMLCIEASRAETPSNLPP